MNKRWIFLENKNKTLKESKEIYVVPTTIDPICKDSLWCATFALVWNDLKSEVIKKDISFPFQNEFVTHLNKQSFTEDMISSEYYYKIYGLKTKELKKQIVEDIQKKFRQKSDILDRFNWNEEKTNSDLKHYFFYTMLYRKFEFFQKMDRLEMGKFGKENSISYFGIQKKTDVSVRKQIEVLYYSNENEFALLIHTKSKDDVFFLKNPHGNNFEEIYNNMKKEAENYEGNSYFCPTDELKIPYLSFHVLKEYEELENIEFETEMGKGKIDKALQMVQFSLDEKGGEIKSEAGIDVNTISLPIIEDSRYFFLDDTFALFLKEKNKDIPYFAVRIEDIKKFQ